MIFAESYNESNTMSYVGHRIKFEEKWKGNIFEGDKRGFVASVKNCTLKTCQKNLVQCLKLKAFRIRKSVNIDVSLINKRKIFLKIKPNKSLKFQLNCPILI
ncbi:hypothetical protein ACFFRR_006166 [Megaselia abdita]